jgi:hypothetical protein
MQLLKHITDNIRRREEASQKACSIENVVEDLQMRLTVEGLCVSIREGYSKLGNESLQGILMYTTGET